MDKVLTIEKEEETGKAGQPYTHPQRLPTQAQVGRRQRVGKAAIREVKAEKLGKSLCKQRVPLLLA